MGKENNKGQGVKKRKRKTNGFALRIQHSLVRLESRDACGSISLLGSPLFDFLYYSNIVQDRIIGNYVS